MVETMEELGDLLENIKNDAEKNTKKINKHLSTLSKKLEDLTDDNESIDSIKDYLDELKNTLEERYVFVTKEFNKINSTCKSISKESKTIAKTSEIEETFNTFSGKLSNIDTNIQDILKNLIVMDPSAQNDVVKRELENLYLAVNSILTELHSTTYPEYSGETNIELTDKLIDLKELICKNVKSRDENFVSLEKKLDDYISNVEKITDSANIKIGNSLSEIIDLKTEIEGVRNTIGQWNFEQEDKDSKIMLSISSELDEVRDYITNLQESIQKGITKEFSNNATTIEKQINNLIGTIEELKSSNEKTTKNDDLETPLKEVKDKITAVKQEINLVNTDIIDTLNAKTESIISELIPLKQAIENIEHTLNCPTRPEIVMTSITENDTSQPTQVNTEEIQNAIGNIKGLINKELDKNREYYENLINNAKNDISDEIANCENNISQLLDILNEKVDILASTSDETVLDEIYEVKNMISFQRDLLENSEDKNKITFIQSNLEELIKKIDTLESTGIKDMESNILTTILNVFEQISFIEESEDIKDFVEEKTDEINQSLTEVKQQLKHLASNDNDENYTYTLQDVESDIAKLRLVLNEISTTSSSEEISDISNNIHRIVSTVEDMQNSLTQEQVSELKNNLEKLSEDVVSISSRTNKLLLSSDESYQYFSGVIKQLEERMTYLDNKEITERVEEKLDNALSLVVETANSNKVMRQALTYMGEWIDSTSENLNTLKEKTDKIDEIQDIITELKTKAPEQTELLNTLSEKYNEQEERMDRIEIRLERILSAINDIDDTKLTKKVDKIDKEIAKLSTSIEKLTSYVD